MLQVSNLHKTYSGIHSVKGVSFTAGDHEAVALLGQNGAGKSTTMRMLAGFLAPTSGEIRLDGLDMAEQPCKTKARIGYLPEIPPLYPDCTVLEHLRFVCALRSIPPREIKRECERVCGLLNITPVAGRVIGRLSKGYRQRVGFAAALVGTPSLLILDEPTVGLDPQQVIEIRGLILALATQMTVLISSHILSEIACVCTHLLILHHGELLADGSAEDITDRYREHSLLDVAVRGNHELAQAELTRLVQGTGTLTMEARLAQEETRFLLRTPKGRDMAEAVFQTLAAHKESVSLVSLQKRTPSLEEIFIEMTQGQPPVDASCRAEEGGCIQP